jgi:hypothetical protein
LQCTACPPACLPVHLQVLGFLNQKRPANVEREAVFLQADAFAVLVQMDFVAADGEHAHAYTVRTASDELHGCTCLSI